MFGLTVASFKSLLLSNICLLFKSAPVKFSTISKPPATTPFNILTPSFFESKIFLIVSSLLSTTPFTVVSKNPPILPIILSAAPVKSPSFKALVTSFNPVSADCLKFFAVKLPSAKILGIALDTVNLPCAKSSDAFVEPKAVPALYAMLVKPSMFLSILVKISICSLAKSSILFSA